MLAQYLDITDDLNTNGFSIIDVSNYDYVLLQCVNTLEDSTTLNFYASIDSGAIQGVSDGSAISATNFASIKGLDISNNFTDSKTPKYMTTIYKFNVIGKYVKFEYTQGQYPKVLVMLSKIS